MYDPIIPNSWKNILETHEKTMRMRGLVVELLFEKIFEERPVLTDEGFYEPTSTFCAALPVISFVEVEDGETDLS